MAQTVDSGGQHGLRLEGRRRLTVTGVTGVSSFDEKGVGLQTREGGLAVRGEGLDMARLDLDRGEAEVTGLISSLDYDEEGGQRGSLWSRLWR